MEDQERKCVHTVDDDWKARWEAIEQKRYGAVECEYRRHLRKSIAGRLEGPYVSTGALAFIAEVLCGWESAGHSIQIFADEVRAFCPDNPERD